MCRNLISRKVFDLLSDHILEVEKKKSILIEKYYKEKIEESIDVEDFFREYTKNINNFLSTAGIDENKDCNCPFVIIGSTVEVQDPEDLETYQYRIVFPYSTNEDMSIDHASCLSPLGKALLFNEIGQPVKIQIPTGTLNYIIKNVILHGESVSECIKK